MSFDPAVVTCSTITLRHLPLDEALAAIADASFTAVDLGALPGVCDHVPVPLDDDAVALVASTVATSGLAVTSVNADVGDLNEPLDAAAAESRAHHVDRLLALCRAVGARALVLPNGRQSHDPIVSAAADTTLVAAELSRIADAAGAAGIELWVEAPHFFRLHHSIATSEPLFAALPDSVGVVCDTSHIVASGGTVREFLQRVGDRVRHVHIRDAEPGYIHHSVGRGVVDFDDSLAALREYGYDGVFALELETRDTDNDDRARVARETAETISSIHAEQGKQ